jgi:iron complex outermembrane receptor protein
MNDRVRPSRRPSALRRRLLVAVPATLCAGAAAADPAVGTSADTALRASPAAVFELGQVVVAGAAQNAEQVSEPGSFSLVTEETMNRFDQRRLSEALAEVPGLTLTPGANGGPRAEQRIFLRGFSGLEFPVMLDGVPFYVSWDGEPDDLSRFTTFDLSAIEVSKGYASLSYGPGALGGAINLVTRRPTRPLEANFAASDDADDASPYRGYTVRGNLGGRRGSWYAQLGAAATQTTSWRLPESFEPQGPVQLAAPPGNLEDGGQRQRSASHDARVNLRLGYAPDEHDEYALSYYEQRARKQAPYYAGPPDANQTVRYFDWPSWDTRGYNLITRSQLGRAVYLKTRLYNEHFENSLYAYDDPSYSSFNKKSSFRSQYDDYSTGASLESGWTALPNLEVLGTAHLRWDDHHDISLYPDRTPPVLRFQDRTWSVGGELHWRPAERWELRGGYSYDRRDPLHAQDQNRAGASFELDSQQADNAQLGLSYALQAAGTDGQLYASVARKSRFPSMSERYSYRLGSALPNPALRLERATNYQAGFRGRLGRRLSFDGSLFLSDLSDLIQPVTVAPGVVQNQNVGNAQYRGADLDFKYRVLAPLRLGLAYSLLDRESRSEPAPILYGTPRHTLHAYLEYDWRGIVQILPSVDAATGRKSTTIAAENGNPVGGYTLFGLRAIWSVDARNRLEFTGRNLGDRLYDLTYGYPMPGRSYSLTYRWEY